MTSKLEEALKTLVALRDLHVQHVGEDSEIVKDLNIILAEINSKTE